jgi:hypothetical protein
MTLNCDMAFLIKIIAIRTKSNCRSVWWPRWWFVTRRLCLRCWVILFHNVSQMPNVQLTDGGPSVTRGLPGCVAGLKLGAARGSVLSCSSTLPVLTKMSTCVDRPG